MSEDAAAALKSLGLEPSEPKLNSDQAALYIGMSKRVLWRAAANGQIDHFRNCPSGPASKLYFTKSALDKWLASIYVEASS